jgi:feruloyl esterase
VSYFNSLHIPNLTVTAAADIAAANGLPEFCDVKGTFDTSDEGAPPGKPGFQIDLPANWNKKFMFQGGGGFDGFLQQGTPQNLAKGYATASTNSGYTAGFLDASFAVISPGVPNKSTIADFLYRSRHEVTVAAKQLVLAYYGAKQLEHSYFGGCSNGGHEGLTEAIHYPEDFDGIWSDVPWVNQPGNEEWQLRTIKSLLTTYIPYSVGPALNAAVLANCDNLDGVADGLIQNPAKCSFNPHSLVPKVLTSKQADVISLYLQAVRDQHGKIIYPGASVSNLGDTESLGLPSPQDSFGTGILSNELSTLPLYPTSAQPWGTTFSAGPINWGLAYGVIADLGYWDPSINLTGNLVVDDQGRVNDQANKLLYERLAPGLANQASMLLPFMKIGHKLIIYDGYSDSVLNPYATVKLYKDLAGLAGGYDQAQKNVRLFMVPGSGHSGCGPVVGSGPNTFDMLTPLENWVEHGQAPDGIIASHSVGNNPANAVDRTMPLCKFPEAAKYDGRGPVNNAASWSCPANDRRLLEIGPNGQSAGLSDDDHDHDHDH